MPTGRHRLVPANKPRRVRRWAALSSAGVMAATAVVGLTPTVASADTVRCVGIPSERPAFVCYTSPRFNQSGFQRSYVAIFPVICYGVGCTAEESTVYTPGGDIDGRFTSILYLGHTYEVYRPAASQPYLLTSDNPDLTPAEELQILAFSTLLPATG